MASTTYDHLVLATDPHSSPSDAKQASAAMHSQLTNAAYVAQLCHAAGDVSLPIAARQMAVVVVKNAPISRSDPRLAAILADSLPPLLRDPHISRVAALTLAKCIVEGDPAVWYPVFSSLVDNWQPTEAVLRCLALVAQDAPAESKGALIPAAVLVANSIGSGELGGHAPSIKLGFILIGAVLGALGVQASAEFAEAVQRLFDQSIAIGLVSLDGVAESRDIEVRDFEVERECVRFFISVCHAAAATEVAILAVVPSLVSRTVECLCSNWPAYVSYVLEVDDPHDGLAAYVAQLLELLEELLTSDSLGPAAAVALMEGPHCDWGTVVNLLLRYGVATPRRVEEWLENPNAYLKDEDDRAVALSLQARDTAIEALRLAVRRRPETALAVAMQQCSNILMADDGVASVAAAGNSANLGWRLRESAICAVESLASKCRKLLIQYELTGGMPALLRAVYEVDLVNPCPPSPCLPARALTLFGTVMRKAKVFLSPEASNDLVRLLLPACANSLANSSTPLLSVVSCRTMRPLLAQATAECLSENSPAVPQAALSFLASPNATDEVLYAALETLYEWSERVPLHTPAGLESAPEIICWCWKSNLADPNVGELVVDVFRSLTTRHPESEPSLLMCLPWLGEVLRGCEDPGTMCIIPYILEIVERILKLGSGASASAAYGGLLTPLCSLVLSNEDSGIVHTALKCVAAVVERAGLATASRLTAEVLPSALAYPPSLPGLDEEPMAAPLTDVVLSVLLTVLNPDRKESTLMNSGRSLDRLLGLVIYAGHAHTTTVLHAFVTRAAQVRTDSVLQQVLLPLLSSIRTDASTALNLLGAASVTELFALTCSHAQFFDGLPLVASVDVMIGCLDHCDALNLGGLDVPRAVAQRVSVPLPLALFVSLSRVLVALHDGEIHSSDEDDVDEGGADGAPGAHEEDGWSSEASETDDDEQRGAASEGAGMETPESTTTSCTTSPTTNNPPRPAKLRDRVVGCLSRWVDSLGPAAAPYLSARHRTKLQKLWAARHTS